MRFRLIPILVLGALVAATNACASPTPIPLNPTAVPTAPAVALATTPPTRVPTVPPTENSLPTNAPAPTDAIEPTEPPASTEPPPPTEAPSPTVPPAVPASPDFFGASTYGEIIHNDQVRALAIVAGVRMVRTSVDWANIEKNKGEFKWGGADGALKPLLENNLVPLVLILNNPEWASNTPCGPVNDLLAFDEFMRALVGRYRNVKYWALYNEPDNSKYPAQVGGGCFGGADLNGNGKPDTQDYAEQLHVAWRAIHQTNPDAVLVTGALAFDNFDEASAPPGYPGGGNGGSFNYNFTHDLIAYMQANPLPDGEKYFDTLAFNFYSIYGPYWESQVGNVNVGAKAAMLRKIMNDAGMDAPLLVSETGSDSGGAGNEGQSQNVVKLFTRGLANHLTHMVWWTFQDFPDSAPPPSNLWKYGLIDQNQNPKPSYAAYQTITRQLSGAAFSQALQVQGGEGYLFTRDNQSKVVVWSASDSPITIAFAGKTLHVTDMYGAERVVNDGSAEDNDQTDGRITLAVTKSPIYVEAPR